MPGPAPSLPPSVPPPGGPFGTGGCFEIGTGVGGGGGRDGISAVSTGLGGGGRPPAVLTGLDERGGAASDVSQTAAPPPRARNTIPANTRNQRDPRGAFFCAFGMTVIEDTCGATSRPRAGGPWSLFDAGNESSTPDRHRHFRHQIGSNGASGPGPSRQARTSGKAMATTHLTCSALSRRRSGARRRDRQRLQALQLGRFAPALQSRRLLSAGRSRTRKFWRRAGAATCFCRAIGISPREPAPLPTPANFVVIMPADAPPPCNGRRDVFLIVDYERLNEL